jgi:hypothetical protein
MHTTTNQITDAYTGDVIAVRVEQTREGDRKLIWLTVHKPGDNPAFDEPIRKIGLDFEAARQLTGELYDARSALSPWRNRYPDGRHIFYEGDTPELFVEQIKSEFGFDPSADENWSCWLPGLDHVSYSFYCAPEHLDAIIGGRRWPLR